MSAAASHAVFRWFAAPDLPRPDLRRRARALWLVSWPFLAVVTAALGLAVLAEPDTLARRATTVAAVGALIVVLHMISRSGRPLLASWILVLGLSAIVTERAWNTGGIHAPVAVFYALFIVMAGVLIGRRGSVATAGLCAVGAIILTAATSLQWLTPRAGAGSPLGGFVFVLLCIGLALLLQALIAAATARDESGLDAARMLAHDMRTPMQALIAHLEALQENVSARDANQIHAALGRVAALNQMTSTFLDVSRIEAGQMPVSRSLTDVSALSQSVLGSLRALQPARHMAVETAGDSLCHCDRELTRRIIENLVNNAMKHTEAGGRIRVVISGSADRIFIAVHDDGAGVPREKRERIFERFYSGGSLSRPGVASSGLGLAFCRLAAEAHGGSIRIEDGAAGGSVFVVELPR